jgi:hypothetical protein
MPSNIFGENIRSNSEGAPVLRFKERRDETQFSTKIARKTSLGPSYFIFVRFSFPVTRLMPKLAVVTP